LYENDVLIVQKTWCLLYRKLDVIYTGNKDYALIIVLNTNFLLKIQ
jgi:hypothetical protein